MLMNPRNSSSGQKTQHEKTLSVVFNHRRFERSSGAGVVNCTVDAEKVQIKYTVQVLLVEKLCH